MEESSESILVQENGIYVVNGNMKVDGNLEVNSQLAARELKIVGEKLLPIMSTSGDCISFRKSCEFKDAVQFCNGRTVIGKETTYNSAYVGTETLQAGQRLVIGDSLFKITADERKIIADTFKMTLARLDVDNLVSQKHYANAIDVKKVKVSEELIGQNIYADTIKTNKLFLDSIGSRSLQTTENMTTKDLIVGGSAKIENDLTIVGTGVGPNGAALTVNGGPLIANYGIISHTRKNEFQCLEIMGSRTSHDVCFKVDRNVDSLFEGDVTVEGSRLILDNSKLVTDNIIVTPLSEIQSEEPLSGVHITTSSTWDTYKEGMIQELDTPHSVEDEYDVVKYINEAIERNESNYEAAHETVKSLIDPITYLMEQNNGSIPKRFNVKNGVYRIDNGGNALFRNVVAEKARFSKLEAFRFNVNRLGVDKLITTAVASNVVHTDKLLKSEGIAEFDGAVRCAADVFIEKGSKVNVSEDASMTFQNGATLAIKNGAKFEMGSDTTVKMGGDIEIDFNKLVFVDSRTGKKYRISFRDAHECEGGGVVMDYKRVPSARPPTPPEIVEETELDSRELDKKLKTLGI